MRPIDPVSGFLQEFPVSYTLVDEAEMVLRLPGKAASGSEPEFVEKRLAPRKDFLPYFFSGSAAREAGLVFVGWGISAPEIGYDDYAGLDVRGQYVLCVQGSPNSSDPAFAPYNRHLVRQKTAREKGAAGLLYIQAAIVGSPNGEWQADFLPGVISTAVADTLFAERGLTNAQVTQSLRSFGRPLSFPLRARLRYTVRARHFDQAKGYNVVGWIPGSDPALRGEYLVIGGHLDHLGRHLGETYYGANDNASGSAVVLGLARALSRRARPLKRSVVFVLFGGEEMNLAGSRYFVDHPPAALKAFDAMFNFDMNGVGSGLACYHGAGAAELVAALRQADEGTKLLRQLDEATTPSGSDYAAFLLKKIPFLSFFSDNFEAKFHIPEDTCYQVNPDIMADIARVALRAAILRADR
ncbi:MAG TPA: M28 family peptidase [Candidatus Aminicenantes bacterium]|nr:M28 family peptidase [Candidatus Aminicenantes bacterium]HRY66184.1 M28 family peptidase [Candidatus Aminicenantes bacterium]HRZ73098.1 M28 family peptidase [Candidatus Aminicenantes bacterium]